MNKQCWQDGLAGDSGLEMSKLHDFLSQAKDAPNDVIENIIFELQTELTERDLVEGCLVPNPTTAIDQ